MIWQNFLVFLYWHPNPSQRADLAPAMNSSSRQTGRRSFWHQPHLSCPTPLLWAFKHFHPRHMLQIGLGMLYVDRQKIFWHPCLQPPPLWAFNHFCGPQLFWPQNFQAKMSPMIFGSKCWAEVEKSVSEECNYTWKLLNSSEFNLREKRKSFPNSNS